jgi:repressor of nif and glnA expression
MEQAIGSDSERQIISILRILSESTEPLGSIIIPNGQVGLAAVCSVAVIECSGTSIDPSEQFIRARMTSVSKTARTGNGKALGVFRTIPAPTGEVVKKSLRYSRMPASVGFTLSVIPANRSDRFQ